MESPLETGIWILIGIGAIYMLARSAKAGGGCCGMPVDHRHSVTKHSECGAPGTSKRTG